MAAQDYTGVVQQLYVSYFGRPADYFGLKNFTEQLDAMGAPKTFAELSAAVQSEPNGALAQLVGNFSNSPESIALYGNDNSELGISKFVTAIYKNFLGREPDLEGYNFWVDAIQSGGLDKANAAAAITQGALANTTAQGLKDAKVVANKLAVATSFTDALDTPSEFNAYEGDAAAATARALLQGVNDTTNLTNYQSNVNAAVTAIVGGAAVGTTFTLTAGSDTGAAFTGGAGNDIFNAGVAATANGGLVDTLQNVDQLVGGAGVDTLNVTLNSAVPVAPTLSGIENVNVRVTAVGGGISLVGATGVTAVNVNNSTANAVVTNAGAAALGVANQKTAVSFSGSTASALTLNLDTVGTAATDIAVDIGGTVANAATSFVINAKDAHVTFSETIGGATTTSASVAATGANEITFAAADQASLKTLTVTGAGSADFTGGALSALTTLTAGDGGVKVTGTSAAATALTATTGAGADTLVFNGVNVKSIATGAGNDAVVLNTGALAATATVALGEGNDSVTLSGAAPTAGATIDGGAGTDTFGTTTAIYNTISGYTAAQRALISNFEVLSITDTLANGAAIDVSSLTGVGSFTAAAGVAAGGNATVNKLGANSTVTIAGANTVGTAPQAQISTATITGATDNALDLVSIVINGTTYTTAPGVYADGTAIAAALATAAAAAPGVTVAAANGVLTFTAQTAGVPFTVGAIAAVAGGGAPDTVTKVDATPTPNVVGVPGVGGSLTANLATDTAADAMTLVLNNNYIDNNDTTVDSRAASNKFVAADVESLTVNSTGKISPALGTKVDGYKADVLTNTLDLTGSNKLTSIVVTGDQKLTLVTTAAQTKLATIDASANTAGVTIDASAATATSAALTIKGTAQADVITGGALGDTITLGAGNDIVVYSTSGSVSKIGTGAFDTITDFAANTYGNSAVTAGAAGTGAAADVTKWTGDVLQFRGDGGVGGVVVDKFTSAADATTFLANNAGTTAGLIAAFDSTNSNLYVDNTGDGVADFFIHLTGVTTIDAAAFVVTTL